MLNSELIVVKQLPIIEQQLKKASEEIDEKVKEATSLVCNEENIKTIKDVRANLNKELKEFEEKRKQVKSEVIKPYEDFEKIYKEYISDKYKNADAELKNKVDSVENELKANKKAEVERYFNEYIESKGIDFVTFENLNINVTLSSSLKSLKEAARNFIDKIVEDLNIIEMQEHKAEILVEYKQSLNVSQAIVNVNNRIKAIEEEKQKAEKEKELQKFIIDTAREGDKVALVNEEQNEATNLNENHNNIDKPLEAPEVKITVVFKVTDTKERIRQIKKFLEDGGYKYE